MDRYAVFKPIGQLVTLKTRLCRDPGDPYPVSGIKEIGCWSYIWSLVGKRQSAIVRAITFSFPFVQIQLTQAQLQLIRMQLQGGAAAGNTQSVVIQAQQQTTPDQQPTVVHVTQPTQQVSFSRLNSCLIC